MKYNYFCVGNHRRALILAILRIIVDIKCIALKKENILQNKRGGSTSTIIDASPRHKNIHFMKLVFLTNPSTETSFNSQSIDYTELDLLLHISNNSPLTPQSFCVYICYIGVAMAIFLSFLYNKRVTSVSQ